VRRDYFTLYIYSADLSRVLAKHDVTWSRRDSFCKDQYVSVQPEELPSAPVRIQIRQVDPPETNTAFDKFNFEEGLWNE
jgi:hypothetical protein